MPFRFFLHFYARACIVEAPMDLRVYLVRLTVCLVACVLRVTASASDTLGTLLIKACVIATARCA